jgi:hypothetical protein
VNNEFKRMEESLQHLEVVSIVSEDHAASIFRVDPYLLSVFKVDSKPCL